MQEWHVSGRRVQRGTAKREARELDGRGTWTSDAFPGLQPEKVIKPARDPVSGRRNNFRTGSEM
jgi:hypothetical protein